MMLAITPTTLPCKAVSDNHCLIIVIQSKSTTQYVEPSCNVVRYIHYIIALAKSTST